MQYACIGKIQKSKFFSSDYFVFFAFLILAFVVFSNVINGPFTFDDESLVVNNLDVHSLSNVWSFFTSDPRAGSLLPGVNMYRPLSTLVYAIIYHFFGLNVVAYHFFNIFIHVINGFIVYRLFTLLDCKKWCSVFFTLFFLIHPVQAESVSYISGQPDVLSSFFVLFPLFLFAHAQWFCRSFLRNTLIVGVLFISGMLVKESGVIFPALAALILIYKWKSLTATERKQYLYALLFFSLLACCYLFLRFTVLVFSDGSLAQDSIYESSLYIRLVTSAHYFLDYIRLVFFPLHLAIDKSFEGQTVLTFRAIIGVAIVFEMLFLMCKSFFNKKVLFFGFGVFFAALAPVSGIMPVNAPYMEHWLYIPLVGLLFIPAFFFSHWSLFISQPFAKWRNIMMISLLILLIVCGARLYVRNADWADPVAFYENEIALNPKAARSYNNLATFYFRNDEFEKAEEYYLVSAHLRPDATRYYNLGNFYATFGDLEKSIVYFFHSLENNPSFIYSYIGMLHLLEGMADEEIIHIIKNNIILLQEGHQLGLEEVSFLKSILLP